MSERKAGRDLDAEIAEKVMGLVPCTNERCMAVGYCYALPESPDQGGELRPYSVEIEDAWQVVVRMRERGFRTTVFVGADGLNSAIVFKPAEQRTGQRRGIRGEVESFSVPEAICLAALAATSPDRGDER